MLWVGVCIILAAFIIGDSVDKGLDKIAKTLKKTKIIVEIEEDE